MDVIGCTNLKHWNVDKKKNFRKIYRIGAAIRRVAEGLRGGFFLAHNRIFGPACGPQDFLAHI